MSKQIGLFFGTYNPIHVGHLIIANYMADFTELDEVWLVVTPHNPFKEKKSLLADYHRLALVREAISENTKIRASDVEFNLPQPSYTIHTLAYLEDQYPDYHFSLIMGEDNLRTVHKWKEHQLMLERHKIYVYPRPLTEQEIEELSNHTTDDNIEHPNIHRLEAPVMKLSSSFIRNAIKAGKDVRYMLTEPVYRYVKEMHFYE